MSSRDFLFPHPKVVLGEAVIVTLYEIEQLREERALALTSMGIERIDREIFARSDFLARWLHYSLMYAIEDYQ